MTGSGVEGLHAIITGAGKGIGRAAAIALAKGGAHVYVASRCLSDLEGVCNEVRTSGGRATPVVADVTRETDRHHLMAAMPRVDLLVNSAGANVPQPFQEVSNETLEHLIGVNVRAVFQMSQAVVVKMLAQGGGGAIINISSQMGHVGAPNRTVYCMTKHAVEGLTKAMAIELGPHRIRVNTIAPTFVQTDFTKPFLADPQFRDWVLARIPLGRIGTVEDVAAAVLFLASSNAAMITGTSLLVDGGWTAQ